MTQKTFFIVLAIVIFAMASLAYVTYKPDKEEVANPTTPPVFSFTTEESSELNLDGIPKTNVFVEAVYATKTEKKLIDTQSGCNALSENEKDGAEFQCYAAGAGYRYKIVKGEQAYTVERKAIEEGLPNQAPQTFEYETIEQFPLMVK